MKVYRKSLFQTRLSLAKRSTVETLCMFLVPLMVLLAAGSCEKRTNMEIPPNENSETEPEEVVIQDTCVFDNPLTDIPWMKELIHEINQENGEVIIYQCTYGEEQTGFLEDRGNIAFFYNCKGETLCIMGGDAGETCSALNIVCKKLIWEKNVSSDCGCSPDSLQNITWKLVGIVDAQTGDITELEPKNCELCYTLLFDTTSILFNLENLKQLGIFIEFPLYFSGRSRNNTIWGVTDISSCSVVKVTHTSVGESAVYLDALHSAQFFCLQGYSLKVYYNNKQNYLLYKTSNYE